MADASRTRLLQEQFSRLSESQLLTVENIVTQFERPLEATRHVESDLVTECVLQEFGDTLRIHHCFSSEAFTKDKFEHAFAKVCNFCGIEARLARRGNPGHDITINGTPISLKTQANTGIKSTHLHISKFMELGKGKWGNNVNDLKGLRDRFFQHMRNYDRIVMLRRLREPGFHLYELVEIPKALLLEAEDGKVSVMATSKQTPKPGYCIVKDSAGLTKFELYFDGGTERKLQVRHIDKNLCRIHAIWRLDDDTKLTEDVVV